MFQVMTYSSIVSRDTIGVEFLVVPLNGIDFLAGDIHNFFLKAPTK